MATTLKAAVDAAQGLMRVLGGKGLRRSEGAVRAQQDQHHDSPEQSVVKDVAADQGIQHDKGEHCPERQADGPGGRRPEERRQDEGRKEQDADNSELRRELKHGIVGIAVDLAAAVPEVPIILDHSGLPADRSEAGLRGWRAAMAEIARVPHATVKISGLGVPGRAWTAGLQRRVVHETIELFGTGRCMFGSNFPVDSLVASLETIWSGFLTLTRGLAGTERRALSYENARRIYRLP